MRMSFFRGSAGSGPKLSSKLEGASRENAIRTNTAGGAGVPAVIVRVSHCLRVALFLLLDLHSPPTRRRCPDQSLECTRECGFGFIAYIECYRRNGRVGLA
jgi:hypothetical protein